MSTLAPGYDPTQFETRLYERWESSGAFRPRGMHCWYFDAERKGYSGVAVF